MNQVSQKDEEEKSETAVNANEIILKRMMIFTQCGLHPNEIFKPPPGGAADEQETKNGIKKPANRTSEPHEIPAQNSGQNSALKRNHHFAPGEPSPTS